MVGLASAMGIQVTAEGVETEAQRLALLELGATHGQGYYFARPEDPASLARRMPVPRPVAPITKP